MNKIEIRKKKFTMTIKIGVTQRLIFNVQY